MRKTNSFLAVSLLVLFLGAGICQAHTPLCSCYDNGDGTVTCEGGGSDGSSAAGVEMRLEDASGKIMLKGKMDEDSEYTFDKPSGDYTVIFDAGDGHNIRVSSKEITE